jgi:aminoglycoside phosphotransferase (APT) family kinase protein
MRDADLARAIAERLGVPVRRIREIVGQGEVNHVFVVNEELVVRFSRDPLDTDDYAKEAWCLRIVRKHGVPVPGLVGTGNLDGVPYILQQFVAGKIGSRNPTTEFWRTLGQYSRLIGDIPLDDAPNSLFPRFGRDLRSNWLQHVDYNLVALGGDDPLIGLGVYEHSQSELLRKVFNDLRAFDAFGLSHGDLVPKNMILSEDGTLVVIDWGSATTGPLPEFDVLRIWADPDFALEDARAFADGYGTSLEEYLPRLRVLRLLGRIDVVRWAIDQRPDRIDTLAKEARRVVQESLPR